MTAKSKVAPLRQLSILRLELSAAHVLAKLAKSYLLITRFCIFSANLSSDSTDVLQWLKIHADVLWHNMNSKDNPADVLSRGCTATELNQKQLWWTGPSWLKGNQCPWISVKMEQPQLGEIPPKETANPIESQVAVELRYQWDILY